MQEPKKIVIVGGSGFIGTKLSEELLKAGYVVSVLDRAFPRTRHEHFSYVHTDTSKLVTPHMLAGAYAVINLAGAPISKRWSSEYKKVIHSSRIHTTKNIVMAIADLSERPEVLVSASAVGYYGDRGTETISELTPAGTDFLARVCEEWELEANAARVFGVRVVNIRTANVLGPGGLLQSLRPLFAWGLGGYFGRGTQYMPWVHWKDIVGMYMYAVEHPLKGPYNTAAPEIVTQQELFTAFAHSIHAPWVWSIPALVARVGVGEFAGALFESQRVVSAKIQDEGYVFAVPTLTQALAQK